jgi:methylase of polypeptide subunit release factors
MNLKIKNALAVSKANIDSELFTHYILSTQPKKFLDMGTGTGYIACKLATLGVDVHACDISMGAVRLAKQNAKRNKLDFPIYQSDLFSRVDGQFDAIAFNVPFSMGADIFPLNIIKGITREIGFVEHYLMNPVPKKVLHQREILITQFIVSSLDYLMYQGKVFLGVYEEEVRIVNAFERDFYVHCHREPALAERRVVFIQLQKKS